MPGKHLNPGRGCAHTSAFPGQVEMQKHPVPGGEGARRSLHQALLQHRRPFHSSQAWLGRRAPSLWVCFFWQGVGQRASALCTLTKHGCRMRSCPPLDGAEPGAQPSGWQFPFQHRTPPGFTPSILHPAAALTTSGQRGHPQRPAWPPPVWPPPAPVAVAPVHPCGRRPPPHRRRLALTLPPRHAARRRAEEAGFKAEACY